MSEIDAIIAVNTLDAVDAMVVVHAVRADDTVALVGAVWVWVRWLQMVQYIKLQTVQSAMYALEMFSRC